MSQLWGHGSLTIRRITEAIYANPTTAKYATVQRQLDRLEEKGFVRRRKSAGVNEFESIVSRSDLLGQSLQRLADRLCAGSLTPIVANIATRTAMSEEQREALQRLIDEFEEES